MHHASFMTQCCPPPFAPRRGMHPFPVALFAASPCRAALSAPLCLPLRLVLPFVSSSPSSRRTRRPLCLVVPTIPFVSSPLRCVTLRRPVGVALTAPFVASPQRVALSEVICAVGVFLFSFLFSTDAPFFYRCIGVPLFRDTVPFRSRTEATLCVIFFFFFIC